jgi:YD repeat-containing protein
VRLLHATGGRGGLARRLGGELLAGRLATGRLAGSLLRTGWRRRMGREGASNVSERTREGEASKRGSKKKRVFV